MKHVMKTLKHNGIYVPPYDYKGFSVKIQNQTLKLSEKTEPMAVAWIRKTLSTASPPDSIFKKNFMKEFLNKLKEENPQAKFLETFIPKYITSLDVPPTTLNNGSQPTADEIDLSQVSNYIVQEKAAKEAITKEVKKQQVGRRGKDRVACARSVTTHRYMVACSSQHVLELRQKAFVVVGDQ